MDDMQSAIERCEPLKDYASQEEGCPLSFCKGAQKREEQHWCVARRQGGRCAIDQLASQFDWAGTVLRLSRLARGEICEKCLCPCEACGG